MPNITAGVWHFIFAGIMFVSIVVTALILNALFGLIGIIPESGKEVSNITQFKVDYTFWMNLFFVMVAGWLIYLNNRFHRNHEVEMMEMEGDGPIKQKVVYLFIGINIIGVVAFICANIF